MTIIRYVFENRMQVFQMIATIFYERRDVFEKLGLDKVDKWTILITVCFGQEIIRQKTFVDNK